jgi:5-methylcytosine-specific restriction endonuclease McrA
MRSMFAPNKMCRDCYKPALVGNNHCQGHQTNNNDLDRSRTSDKWRREHDPLRPLYSQARWRGVRARVLFNFPLCYDCGNKASTVADHVIPAHKWVADHGNDIESFYREDNLVGRCTRCHDLKTRKEQAAAARSIAQN